MLQKNGWGGGDRKGIRKWESKDGSRNEMTRGEFVEMIRVIRRKEGQEEVRGAAGQPPKRVPAVGMEVLWRATKIRIDLATS